jgi:DNA-binding NtrC family response regulator
MSEPKPAAAVLVIVADPEVCRLVGWTLDELNLPHFDVATWRDGVAQVTGRPSLVICDIDDLQDSATGITALVARGWGQQVPLITLSRRPDVEEIAGAFGTVEGLRKPINVGRLIAVVHQALQK